MTPQETQEYAALRSRFEVDINQLSAEEVKRMISLSEMENEIMNENIPKHRTRNAWKHKEMDQVHAEVLRLRDLHPRMTLAELFKEAQRVLPKERRWDRISLFDIKRHPYRIEHLGPYFGELKDAYAEFLFRKGRKSIPASAPSAVAQTESPMVSIDPSTNLALEQAKERVVDLFMADPLDFLGHYNQVALASPESGLPHSTALSYIKPEIRLDFKTRIQARQRVETPIQTELPLAGPSSAADMLWHGCASLLDEARKLAQDQASGLEEFKRGLAIFNAKFSRFEKFNPEVLSPVRSNSPTG